MRISPFLLAPFGACSVYSAVIPATHVVHEKRDSPPSQWVKRNRLHSEAVLPMRIGLTQNNLDKGHDFLMDVSHPASPNYARHWTSEEVIRMFAPSENTVAVVREWLVSSGIPNESITHSDNQGWLAFDITTDDAENLLHTKYHEYEHSPTGHTAVACDSYHVPKHVQEHIDYITPGLRLLAARDNGVPVKSRFDVSGHKGGYGTPKPPRRIPYHKPVSTVLADCDRAITPVCIAALYNIPKGTKANPRNAMGIFQEGNFYAQEDLDLFFRNFTPYIPPGTHPKPAFIDGAQAPVPARDAGGESELDFQLAYPILWPQGTVLYQTDDINYAKGAIPTDGGFNTFLDAIDGSYCTYSAYGQTGNDYHDPVYPDPAPGGYSGPLQCGVYTPTNVISISYGGQESDLPPTYQKRQCNEFMKLGLQGISIFYASGDDGVAGPNGCLGPVGIIFNPAWPNTCPYITNVGGTKIYPGYTVSERESAVVDPKDHPYATAYSSGGGFSNIYGVPDYQKAALKDYFEQHNPPYTYYVGDQNGTLGTNGGRYNRNGRGYPDVAAIGDNFAVYVGGNFALYGGTSGSTPVFSSIINRINEERLAIGKKTVGFINPTLYSHPYVLNDIVNGSNPGCGTEGFKAVKGWDPVTGLGTPNYPKMLDLFLGLP